MSITDYVADAGRFTLPQAAKIIGRHPDTLRRWIRDGIIGKPETMTFGAMSVPVFTPDDITAIKEVAKTVKVGRPPKGFGPTVRDPKTKRLRSKEA